MLIDEQYYSKLIKETQLVLFDDISLLQEHITKQENSLKKINGKDYYIDIDINIYKKIAEEPKFTKDANKLISKRLYQDLMKLNIPKFYFFQPEFWTYLNVFIFGDVIKYLYFQKHDKTDEESTEDESNDFEADEKAKEKQKLLNKYLRYFFNAVTLSNISRTGFWFLWLISEKVYDPNNQHFVDIAFDFVDPVKAMIERNQGSNDTVLRAWLEAISKLSEIDQRKLKSSEFRTKVPTHLNNLSVMLSLESLKYEEMVERIYVESSFFINK
jgi:hypothetical protein